MLKKILCLVSIFLVFGLSIIDGLYFDSDTKVTSSTLCNSSGRFYEFYNNEINSLDSLNCQIAKVDKKYSQDFIKKMSASLVKELEINNQKERYYYSKKIMKYIIIDGKKVNIHIVEKEENSILGVPFIFSGY